MNANAFEHHHLVLGSASPRRSDLLTAAGYRFEVITASVDEVAVAAQVEDGDIGQATRKIARAKFDALAHLLTSDDRLVLTADTLVACEGRTMGKPASSEQVLDSLQHVSGKRIAITTSVCVGRVAVDSPPPTHVEVTTFVDLREISAEAVQTYVASGVGLDKAGGLALQAEAGPFMAAVHGCWSNVLGLPLCQVRALVTGGPPQCAGIGCGGD